MTADHSLLSYLTNASVIVQLVLLLLLIASIVSWTLIFQRGLLLRRAHRLLKQFEQRFWSGVQLTKLYQELPQQLTETQGLQAIFRAGFREFVRTYQQTQQTNKAIEGAHRAMQSAQNRVMDGLEHHLAVLATIGSVSPYVGLFGTVWGIMTAFHALGHVQQATIAMVAPGISEALIATAMGLFAAIPAVIAYNRYTNEVERLEMYYETFQQDLIIALQRQQMQSNETE